jgi:hypothetical protein
MSFNIEFTVDGKKVKNIIFELTAKKIMDYDENPINEPNDINIKIPMFSLFGSKSSSTRLTE